MPSLQMTRGDWPGLLYRLDRDETIIGKAAGCDIVLPDEHVSKHHAKIVRRGDGLYIEDLNSTNETKVGRGELQKVTSPRRLTDGDEIKICKYRFSYLEGESPPGTSLTIVETIDVLTASGPRQVGSNLEEKLRAIEAICGGLVGVLDVGAVLERVLDALFRVFPQVERAFIVFGAEDAATLVPRASRSRGPDSGRWAPSRTVYDQVTGGGRAILCEDLAADDRFSQCASLRDSHARTIMGVPLWDHERRPVGVLQLEAEDPRGRFAQEDLDFLIALAT